MSVANDLMVEVLERLRYCRGVLNDQDAVRRDHRTVVPRASAPAVHLVDGDEDPGWMDGGCRERTRLDFTVRVIVRDDEGFAAADPIVTAVVAALDPTTAYAHSARLERGRVSREQEIADADVIAVDLRFRFNYDLQGWTV